MGAFTFGRNWKSFLRNYRPERQKIAQDALLSFLKLDNLKGKTFLDIGSGSGIHSAAAWLAGAARVYSFDYDPDSVEATRQLHCYHGSPSNWTIGQGSALDAGYLRSLGAFDVVYSWGVLHHTGDQWQALRNVVLNMHAQSLLYIALYATEAYPDWQYWLDVKQRYNRSGAIKRFLMEMNLLWNTHLNKKLHKIFHLPSMIQKYKFERGMDLMTDIRDWLGGWPTEFSSVPQVGRFINSLGLSVVAVSTGESISEFLCVQKDQVQNLGYEPINYAGYPYNLPLLETTSLPPGPVWIFGAGRGGDLIFKYLSRHNVPVAGFVDVETKTDVLRRLPLLKVDEFVQRQPTGTPLVLANRYFKENSLRLMKAGFTNMFNAHPLVIMLHRHGPFQDSI